MGQIGCPEMSVTNYQSTLFKIPEQCKSHLQSGKGKAMPLQAWTGPEGSRRLRLPDFKAIGT
jgi:hypothetical protein